MSPDTHFAYIGRAPCGCVGAAMVDALDRAEEVAQFVGDVVRDGWTLERVDTATVRVTLTDCAHTPKWGEAS